MLNRVARYEASRIATASRAIARRAAALAILAAAGAAGGGFSAASDAAKPTDEDTLRVYRLGEVLVTAPAPGAVAAPGVTTLPERVVETRDAGGLDGIASILPAARQGTNSRGETLISIRNAGERQIGIFHDGIPLNAPWDERVDVSLVPAEAVGGIRVTRGIGSVLDGPNLLGGTVHMLTRDLSADGARTRVVFQGGEIRAFRGNVTHLRRSGPWGFLAGGSRRSQDGVTLPGGYVADFNQGESNRRLNSDLRESSLFLRAVHDFSADRRVGLIFMGSDASKGVPPETHIEEARLWRYPEWRRGILALQGETAIGAAKEWRFQGSVSIDRLDMEIDTYSDPTYTTVTATEEGEDATLAVRALGKRELGGNGSLSLSVQHRGTTHGETLIEGGSSAKQEYAQNLSSAALEWQTALAEGSLLRIGAGYDRAETPKSGDKPDRGAIEAPAVSFRLSRTLGEGAQIHLAGGMRSRFPALREMYSGALGRFVPNPDLDAEALTNLELGAGIRRPSYEIAATLFGNLLRDGIVRKSVEVDGSRKFKRVNEQETRTVGLELAGAVVAKSGRRLDAHYAFMPARVKEEGEFEAHAERAAEYVGYIGASGPLGWHLDMLLEAQFTGSQWALDAEGAMSRLEAYRIVNARIAYGIDLQTAKDGEVFVRLNNIFDEVALSQFGLPERGREVVGGVSVEF